MQMSRYAMGLGEMSEQVEVRPHPLLVVGDDAAHKVGLRVVQRGHQLAQRLLVQLPHRAEHPLLRLGGGRALRHLGHSLQADHPVRWGGGI